MKTRRYYTLLLLLIVSTVATLLVMHARVPFWRDADGVRAYVTDQIPLGTPLTEARTKIRDHRWLIQSEWPQPQPMPTYGTARGTRVIHAALGTYRLAFRTDFDAFFGFDDQNRLVEVRVRKMVDAP